MLQKRFCLTFRLKEIENLKNRPVKIMVAMETSSNVDSHISYEIVPR